MGLAKPWKRVEPTHFVKAKFRGITTKTFELPDGSRHQYDVFDKEGVQHAGFVALTTDCKVIVAEHFRAGPEKVMMEIPGGTIDAGEDPLTAAKRELTEETGYTAGSVEPLGFVYKDAYMNAKWHYFLARDCEPTGGGQKLETGEDIAVQLITIDEFLYNARHGRMTDVEAVFLAYEKLMELKKEL